MRFYGFLFKSFLVYKVEVFNTRIYSLSSGSHIIQFLAFAAKKRKNFD